MVLLFFLVLVLNYGISWFNAWSVGRVWVEAKATDSFWPKFLVWCGAIMAASGFTWCYVLIAAVIASAFDLLPTEYIEAMIYLGYLVIIIPVLGSGLGITANSWANFWRQKNVVNGGVAGWNTFAQVYNTYNAVRLIPEALGKVFETLGKSRSNSKGAAGLIVILLVILAASAGILQTIWIVQSTARNHSYGLERQRRSGAFA